MMGDDNAVRPPLLVAANQGTWRGLAVVLSLAPQSESVLKQCAEALLCSGAMLCVKGINRGCTRCCRPAGPGGLTLNHHKPNCSFEHCIDVLVHAGLQEMPRSTRGIDQMRTDVQPVLRALAERFRARIAQRRAASVPAVEVDALLERAQTMRLLTEAQADASPTASRGEVEESEIGSEMRKRVLDNLTTTFASGYKTKVDLEGMLTKDAILDYRQMKTGEKYLVMPHG